MTPRGTTTRAAGTIPGTSMGAPVDHYVERPQGVAWEGERKKDDDDG